MASPRGLSATTVTTALVATMAAASMAGAQAPRACVATFAVHDVAQSQLGRPPLSWRWASLAVADANRAHGTRFRVVRYSGRNDEGSARSLARAIGAARSVTAVVGFHTSRTTAAAGPILDRAGLAYVTGAATRTSLADGSLRGFFRALAANDLQGPAIATAIAEDLHGTSVAVVAQDDPYSSDLAADISRTLRARGLPVTGFVTPLASASYAEVIAALPGDVNVIALPFLSLVDATRFVTQARAAGVTAAFIGGDSLFRAEDAITGAYVVTPSGSIESTAFGRAVAARYRARHGSLDAAHLPAYSAASALAQAARRSCMADGIATRAGVLRELRNVRVTPGLFGRPVSFLPDGNLRGATNFLWRMGPAAPEYVRPIAARPVRTSAQVMADRRSSGAALMAAYSDLLVAGDRVGLERVLAPSFIVQRTDGSWADRAAFLARPPSLRDFSFTDVVERRSGSQLTVRMTATSTLLVDGRPFRGSPAPLLGAWTWNGSRWQLTAQGNFNTPRP